MKALFRLQNYKISRMSRVHLRVFSVKSIVSVTLATAYYVFRVMWHSLTQAVQIRASTGVGRGFP